MSLPLMNAAFECPREQEVADAIAFGRWSDAAGSTLAAHVDGCAVCREVAEIARALHDDRAAALRDAHPPTAAIVWWRATIRARADAARTVMQPITILQGIAGACVAGATAALATFAWRSANPADRIGALVSRFTIDARAASGFTFDHAWLLLLGVAVCLALAPLAVYFTLADE